MTLRDIGVLRWLLPLGALITLIGYWGPWVNHAVAGLVIIGLDLGEYVKFLPVVRSGEIMLWREGFYAPLFAVSLTLSLFVFRPELAYHWAVRAGMVAVAIVAALNMLPPAWSPPLLLTPEFRLQTIGIILCLSAVLVSPFLALLPRLISGVGCAILACAAIWLPVSGFWRVLDAIGALYGHALSPGWGMWVMMVGLVLMGGAAIGLGLTKAAQSE